MDAVIFDCDGVLVDSEAIGQRIELEILAQIGLTYARDEYAGKFLGMGLDEYHAGLNADHEARFGRPLPSGFLDDMGKRHWIEVEAGVTAIEGVAKVLKALRVPKSVASGSPASNLEKKLRKTGLFSAFAPHIYSSQLVARGKPAPDIFLYAAERLGMAPERCVVVEDSGNGVVAALAAGMRVIGFAGGGHCTPNHSERLRAAGAHAVVQHMDDLLASLRGMA